MIRLLALVALLALSGCGVPPIARGSAQDQAVQATARAEHNTAAADQATIDAAKAQATAAELERQAVAQPTTERIKAAADARVASAVADAVAAALRRVAGESRQVAAKAAEDARKEREADAAAADLRRWVQFTRWVGGIAVFLGVLAGGVLGWLTKSPMVGARAAALLGGAGIAIAIFGATTHWLPFLGLAALVAVGIEWAYHHRKAMPAPKPQAPARG